MVRSGFTWPPGKVLWRHDDTCGFRQEGKCLDHLVDGSSTEASTSFTYEDDLNTRGALTLNLTLIKVLEEPYSSISKAEIPDNGGSNLPRNVGASVQNHTAIL